MQIPQATFDRIRAEAQDLKPLRTLLTLLASLLWVLGWLVAKTVGVLWSAVAWSIAATKVGWTDGRGGS